MIHRITFEEFNDWFVESNAYNNKFSPEGRQALFDYLEAYERDMGEQMEFDPIALCIDFTEHDSLGDIMAEYSIKNLENLHDLTAVIECSNGHIIIQNF